MQDWVKDLILLQWISFEFKAISMFSLSPISRTRAPDIFNYYFFFLLPNIFCLPSLHLLHYLFTFCYRKCVHWVGGMVFSSETLETKTLSKILTCLKPGLGRDGVGWEEWSVIFRSQEHVRPLPCISAGSSLGWLSSSKHIVWNKAEGSSLTLGLHCLETL